MKEDTQQTKDSNDEVFAKGDAVRAGCGCILGVIAFVVILLFGIFGK